MNSNNTYCKGMSNIKPMLIGIWCGVGKPKSLNDFLRPLANDINSVTQHDVVVNEHRLDVKIRCFICDSPARSYLKGMLKDFHIISIITIDK